MSTSNEPGGSEPLVSEDYDPESDYPITARIVRLVAIASDRDPCDLRPLGEVIDTDSLDRLINSRTIGGRHVSIEMSIRYEGYRVEIDANGTVEIYVDETG